MGDPPRIVPLVALLALTAPPAMLAAAHLGDGGPELVDWRLDARTYTSWNSWCREGIDDQHVQIVPYEGAVDGDAVQMAHMWCALRFEDVVVDDSWEFAGVSFAVTGLDEPRDLWVEVDVHGDGAGPFGIDGEVVGGAASVGDASVRTLTKAPKTAVNGWRAGTYDIEAYWWLSAPGTKYEYEDLYSVTFLLDILDFRCSNVRPSVPEIELVGFGPDRDMFWTTAEYAIPASSVDPEADPLLYQWNVDRGEPIAGQTLQHVFDEERTLPLESFVIDDPLPRCATAAPGWESLQVFVRTFAPDWVSTLVSPPADRHCVHGTLVPTLGTIPLFAGTCSLVAEVDTLDMDSALVDRAIFRLDGERILGDGSAPWSVSFDSTRYDPGEHTLDVCFEAINDDQHGLMCSPPRAVLVV